MNPIQISGKWENIEMPTFDINRHSQYVDMSGSQGTPSVINNPPVKTSIYESILKHDPNTLRDQLRTTTFQINATDSFGNTALHYAAISDDDRFLKMLLKHPAIDVNTRNRANRTPLHWALDKSDVNVINALVRRKDIQLDDVKDREGRTYREILIQKHPKLATRLFKLRPLEILQALNTNQLDRFVQILDQRSDHVYYFYTGHHPGTLLDIACRSAGNDRFVQILLERGARINAINPNTGKAAIHEAVQHSDMETVQILVKDDECRVDVFDDQGNSVLHHAVRRNDVKIMEILLRRNPFENRQAILQSHLAIDITHRAPRHSIDINAIDQNNQTPLHVALLENKTEAIHILLEQPDIDLDVQKDLSNRTCRQIIDQTFPELVPKLPQIDSNSTRIESLFSLLHKRDLGEFLDRIQSTKPSSTVTDGKYTYLQYACENGMTEIVRGLLQVGINPNEFSFVRKQTPMMIASRAGYHEILFMLLNHPKISYEPIESRTVLHSVIEGMLNAQQDFGNVDSVENRDHYRCLRYVLERVKQTGDLDINYGDENGNTALHLAVSLNDYQVLKDLLDNGAYPSRKNNSGVEPVRMMNPATLQRYLDSCVTSEGHLMRDNYKIIFNYRSLVPPTSSKSPEIETLFAISDEADSRPLIQHPVLRSYLDFKWQALKIYAYVNLVFYAFFWLSLNLYFYHYFTRYEKMQFAQPQFHLLLNITATVLCSVLVLRELYQYMLSPGLYLSSLMNYLEWTLISLVFIFLIFHTNMSLNEAKCLAGFAIIFSSVELISLLGRLPKFSSNLPMLKAVSRSCLKFMVWYSILLLGIAFAFGIFNTIDGIQPDDISLNQPLTFFYNVSIMAMGRVVPPSIADDSSLKLNHVLFLSVFFLAPIINGIALADVTEVETNASLFGIISRVRSIYRIERMAKEDAFGLLRIVDKLAKYVRRRRTPNSIDRTRRNTFRRRITMANFIRPNCQIAIEPNRGNVVLLPVPDSGSSPVPKADSYFEKTSWIIDSAIVADASNILENRNTRNDVLTRRDLERVEQSIEYLTSILEPKSKIPVNLGRDDLTPKEFEGAEEAAPELNAFEVAGVNFES